MLPGHLLSLYKDNLCQGIELQFAVAELSQQHKQDKLCKQR